MRENAKLDSITGSIERKVDSEQKLAKYTRERIYLSR